jgi:glucose-1-phosphate adenylyltransferase
MIAMLLAGGQGSRLGIITKYKAKPAVMYGGKYRMIDFPMSNCINSGVDTVGVLTQYQPLTLNKHIGIGIPWDLDKKNGGVTILSPHVKGGDEGEWYSGSANAVFQNIHFVDGYNPDYVLVLGGDHIYKMDYSKMLAEHRKNNADATVAVLEVPFDEASRFGIMNCRADGEIYEFEEKPQTPKSNLASMGIYIFSWQYLKEALKESDKLHPDSDFGKHIIPMFLADGRRMYAYRFNEYWKDVGTIESYWQSNMELIDTVPAFNLYDNYWKIYTYMDHQPPQFTASCASVQRSLVSEGCEVYGTVINSILGTNVTVMYGARVVDSIVMSNCVICENAVLERCIIDENSTVGANVSIGRGENVPNAEAPKIYDSGISVIGENTVVPDGITIGKNCVVFGKTKPEHFIDSALPSGGTVIAVSNKTAEVAK